MKAKIEELHHSKIGSKVRFTPGLKDGLKELMDFRRSNLSTTQMCWLKKRPVIDCADTVYNPSALIVLILN